MSIEVKTSIELSNMRAAGRIVAEALDAMEQAAKPGESLNELDRICAAIIKRSGATSSFLNYRIGSDVPPYPKVLCASINEVVVHGIPDDRKLANGDIIGLDFGVSIRGFHADAARTVMIGDVAPKKRHLVEVARKALELAIAKAVPRSRTEDIGATVQSYVESEGFNVVRDFVGHGIGRKMHEEPKVPNYGTPNQGKRLKPNMTIAIEPMVNEGTWEVEVLNDGWTVVTKDRRPSAHFEHTVVITDNGPEILTRP